MGKQCGLGTHEQSGSTPKSLIKGIVDAAKKKKGANIPPRLTYALWCDKYRTLPRAGGMDEQDYREIYLNDVLPRIYEAVSNWRNGNGAKLPPSDQAVITWLVKIGAM